jgi:hypothetical protein
MVIWTRYTRNLDLDVGTLWWQVNEKKKNFALCVKMALVCFLGEPCAGKCMKKIVRQLVWTLLFLAQHAS